MPETKSRKLTEAEFYQEIERIRLSFLQLSERVTLGNGGKKFDIDLCHYELLIFELKYIVKNKSSSFELSTVGKMAIKSLYKSILEHCPFEFVQESKKDKETNIDNILC